MFCPQCGTSIEEGSRFCIGCGAPVEDRRNGMEPVIPAADFAPVPPVELPEENVQPQEIYPEPENIQPQESVQPEAVPVQEQAPEMQDAQWPAEPVYYQEQQAPVIDVYSDAQLLESEVEETGKKGKKAKKAKADKQAKPGKKRRVILIVSIVLVVILAVGAFVGVRLYQMNETYKQAKAALEARDFDEALELFDSLDNFKDSATKAGELKRSQETYEEAEELMKDRKFDEAKKLFESLDDYKDAAEMAASKVDYEKAMYLMTCAEENDLEGMELVLREGEAYEEDDASRILFFRAAEQFAALGEYADSAEKADECWIAVAMIYLDREDWNGAEIVMEKMSDDAREDFDVEFMSRVWDDEALEAITESLKEIGSYDELNAEYKEALDKHIDTISQYLDETFRYEELRELVTAYVEGLSYESEALDENGEMLDNLAWYYGCAVKYTALDEMNAKFDYLENDEDLKADNIGLGEYYTNCSRIATDLHEQLNGKTPTEGSNGELCLPYTNNSGCDFVLSYYFAFYNDADEEVGRAEEATLEIKNGETVNISLNVPARCPAWTQWIFYRSFDIVN